MQFIPKTKLSCYDWSEQVQSMKKKIDKTTTWLSYRLVYIETEIELSRHIWPSAVYDENQIGQRPDQSNIWLTCLCLLHCSWLKCIRSFTKDLSHGFIANRWLVHSWFIGLDNPLETKVHHLLIREMVCLGYLGWVSHDECTSVYGCTLDMTYGELWLKAIK